MGYRWDDVVNADLRELQANDWRETAQDLDKWRALVSEAKTHFGSLSQRSNNNPLSGLQMDSEDDTKLLYKKSFQGYSRTCSGTSQQISSGVIQLKKKLSTHKTYIDHQGKEKKDLGMETDICILRRYCIRKRNRFSAKGSCVKSRYSTFTDLNTTAEELTPNSACGDNYSTPDKNPLVTTDLTSLMINNFKYLLNNFIHTHLEDNATKEKVETVFQAVFKMDNKVKRKSSVPKTGMREKMQRSLHHIYKRSKSNKNNKENSLVTLSGFNRNCKIISTLTMPRNIHKQAIYKNKNDHNFQKRKNHKKILSGISSRLFSEYTNDGAFSNGTFVTYVTSSPDKIHQKNTKHYIPSQEQKRKSASTSTDTKAEIETTDKFFNSLIADKKYTNFYIAQSLNIVTAAESDARKHFVRNDIYTMTDINIAKQEVKSAIDACVSSLKPFKKFCRSLQTSVIFKRNDFYSQTSDIVVKHRKNKQISNVESSDNVICFGMQTSKMRYENVLTQVSNTFKEDDTTNKNIPILIGVYNKSINLQTSNTFNGMDFDTQTSQLLIADNITNKNHNSMKTGFQFNSNKNLSIQNSNIESGFIQLNKQESNKACCCIQTSRVIKGTSIIDTSKKSHGVPETKALIAHFLKQKFNFSPTQSSKNSTKKLIEKYNGKKILYTKKIGKTMKRKPKFNASKMQSYPKFEKIQRKHFTYFYNKVRSKKQEQCEFLRHFKDVLKYFANYTESKNINLDIHVNIVPKIEIMSNEDIKSNQNHMNANIEMIESVFTEQNETDSTSKGGLKYHLDESVKKCSSDRASGISQYIYAEQNKMESHETESLPESGENQQSIQTKTKILQDISYLKAAIENLTNTAQQLIVEYFRNENKSDSQTSKQNRNGNTLSIMLKSVKNTESQSYRSKTTYGTKSDGYSIKTTSKLRSTEEDERTIGLCSCMYPGLSESNKELPISFEHKKKNPVRLVHTSEISKYYRGFELSTSGNRRSKIHSVIKLEKQGRSNKSNTDKSYECKTTTHHSKIFATNKSDMKESYAAKNTFITETKKSISESVRPSINVSLKESTKYVIDYQPEIIPLLDGAVSHTHYIYTNDNKKKQTKNEITEAGTGTGNIKILLGIDEIRAAIAELTDMAQQLIYEYFKNENAESVTVNKSKGSAHTNKELTVLHDRILSGSIVTESTTLYNVNVREKRNTESDFSLNYLRTKKTRSHSVRSTPNLSNTKRIVHNHGISKKRKSHINIQLLKLFSNDIKNYSKHLSVGTNLSSSFLRKQKNLGLLQLVQQSSEQVRKERRRYKKMKICVGSDSEYIIKVTNMSNEGIENTELKNAFSDKAITCTLPKPRSLFEMSQMNMNVMQNIIAYYCDRIVRYPNAFSSGPANFESKKTKTRAPKFQKIEYNKSQCKEDKVNDSNIFSSYIIESSQSSYFVPQAYSDSSMSSLSLNLIDNKKKEITNTSVQIDMGDVPKDETNFKTRQGLSRREILVYGLILWFPVLIVLILLYIYIMLPSWGFPQKNSINGVMSSANYKLNENFSDLGF